MYGGNDSKAVVIGIYDEQGSIAEQVKAQLPRGIETVSIPADQRGLRHIIDKEFLITRSTHLVLVIGDIVSLSILTGAILRLMENSLSGILAVGSISPEHLRLIAQYDPEFHQYYEEPNPRFLIVEHFTPDALNALLNVR